MKNQTLNNTCFGSAILEAWADIFCPAALKLNRVCARSCPALGDPIDCSRPGSSVHGIFRARIHFPTLGDFPDPRIEPVSPALAGEFSTTAPSGKPQEFISLK